MLPPPSLNVKLVCPCLVTSATFLAKRVLVSLTSSLFLELVQIAPASRPAKLLAIVELVMLIGRPSAARTNIPPPASATALLPEIVEFVMLADKVLLFNHIPPPWTGAVLLATVVFNRVSLPPANSMPPPRPTLYGPPRVTELPMIVLT